MLLYILYTSEIPACASVFIRRSSRQRKHNIARLVVSALLYLGPMRVCIKRVCSCPCFCWSGKVFAEGRHCRRRYAARHPLMRSADVRMEKCKDGPLLPREYANLCIYNTPRAYIASVRNSWCSSWCELVFVISIFIIIINTCFDTALNLCLQIYKLCRQLWIPEENMLVMD